MRKTFYIVLMILIVVNTIRYSYYLIQGDISPFFLFMFVINLIGLSLGVVYFRNEKRAKDNQTKKL
ncbi:MULTISPECIES: hypothetical protein [Bacillus]|uniref:hypothetical protein n=1 Tax=Bacillus TaxID=1386 RepID=UPI000BB86A11|nr:MULTISPECIES: hypothetical protein [Bacillus]